MSLTSYAVVGAAAYMGLMQLWCCRGQISWAACADHRAGSRAPQRQHDAHIMFECVRIDGTDATLVLQGGD